MHHCWLAQRFPKSFPMKSQELRSALQPLQLSFVLFSSVLLRVHSCLWQLWAALDEYTPTGLRQDHQFEYAAYSKVFTGYWDMQNQIDWDLKHAAKTRKLCVAWALANKYVIYIISYQPNWSLEQSDISRTAHDCIWWWVPCSFWNDQTHSRAGYYTHFTSPLNYLPYLGIELPTSLR